VGYPGGKSGPGVYHRLINLMPPHETYVEPFLGGGALMRLKLPAAYNIGVDLDAGVIEKWRSLIGGNGAGIREGGITESAGALGGKGVSAGAADPPPSAALGDCADPRRRRSVDSPRVDPPRYRFLRGDGLTFLASYPFAPDDLVYCDPPYLLETLSSRPRYRYNLSDEQHAELVAIIGELPCRVMISGYWSQMYDQALKGWSRINFMAMTRGGMAEEWVWFNFDPPVALHDYRYLGETAHQRQDLKRQIASWTRKLERMPRLKKQALLSAIARVGENGAPRGSSI